MLEVGVKALIKNSRGEYLFLKRLKPYQDENEPRWDIPGGRIEIGEPLHVALRREIQEETGMKMLGEPKIIHAQDILRVVDKHTVRLTYVVEAEGDVTFNEDEHTEFSWLSLSQAEKLHHDLFLTPVFPLLELDILSG